MLLVGKSTSLYEMIPIAQHCAVWAIRPPPPIEINAYFVTFLELDSLRRNLEKIFTDVRACTRRASKGP